MLPSQNVDSYSNEGERYFIKADTVSKLLVSFAVMISRHPHHLTISDITFLVHFAEECRCLKVTSARKLIFAKILLTLRE